MTLWGLNTTVATGTERAVQFKKKLQDSCDSRVTEISIASAVCSDPNGLISFSRKGAQ